MPMITSLGLSRHRFQVGRGLYTQGDVRKGPQPTPSQQSRGIGDSGLDEQWFRLSHSVKRSWQTAANALLWGDLGARPARPTGRELYNRLNRSRHVYTLSTGGTGTWGGLATVSEPPGDPVQLPDMAGLSIRAQAPQEEGPTVTAWEYVQQVYYPPGQPAQAVNPAQRSFGHDCKPDSQTLEHLNSGEAVTNVGSRDYWTDRGYTLWGDVYSPLLMYRQFSSNQIPHYDSFFGGLEIGFNALAANVFLELLWDEVSGSSDGPNAYWHTMGAIAQGARPQGGRAMPFLFADQPDTWAIDDTWPRTTPSPDAGYPQYQSPPNDGLNDLKFMGPWFPQLGCEGASIRMRVWPFDNAGWPGSKLEISGRILAPPPYGPHPDCPY